jgi:hypothetical protein
MTALFILGTVGVLILLLVALAVRRGRAEARLQMAKETLDARDRQLEAANRRARNGDELARRLRAGQF